MYYINSSKRADFLGQSQLFFSFQGCQLANSVNQFAGLAHLGNLRFCDLWINPVKIIADCNWQIGKSMKFVYVQMRNEPKKCAD